MLLAGRSNGYRNYTRSELHTLPLPSRENPKKWVPLNHGILADTVINYIDKVKLKYSGETWTVSPNQNLMLGSLDLETLPLDLPNPSKFSLGIRHDNAGKYAISFAVGARVTVCTNGMFVGDFVLRSRHNKKNIDSLEEKVADGIEQWLGEIRTVERFGQRLSKVQISNAEAAFLIMQAEDKPGGTFRCMNWTHLKDVWHNWEEPPYEEFRPRTLWSLYNCFTCTARTLSPVRQFQMLKGIKELLEITGGIESNAQN